MMKIRNIHPLIVPIRGAFVDLPAPRRISFLWNYGSLLGVVLSLQVVTGLLISFHYVGLDSSSFDSVVHFSRDVSGGVFLRFSHANGASLFFVMLYLHIARGSFFYSFSQRKFV